MQLSQPGPGGKRFPEVPEASASFALGIAEGFELGVHPDKQCRRNEK